MLSLHALCPSGNAFEAALMPDSPGPPWQAKVVDRFKAETRGAARRGRAWAAVLAGAVLSLSGAAAVAASCDELREQIERKIRAGGVTEPRVMVVDAAASAGGRTVGSCDRGARRIVYLPGPGGATAPRRDDQILTECKDGRVLRGGSCKP